jgi:hypothetical protein
LQHTQSLYTVWRSCFDVTGSVHFVEGYDGSASIDVSFDHVNFHRKPYKNVKVIEKYLGFLAKESHCMIYGFTTLVDLGRFLNFLIYTQSVGLLGQGINPS